MGTPNGFPHQEWSLDLSLLLLLAQRTDKSPILYNVNKNRYIFITQALSLPVALESTYKAPSVTLTLSTLIQTDNRSESGKELQTINRIFCTDISGFGNP